MKIKRLAIITAASVVAVGVTVAIAASVKRGSFSISPTKADDTKTLTITAEDIGTAIGAGNSGNFTVGGLEWHVDLASYDAGVATIDGGTLYNVTFAGQSVSPVSGKKGNGFTRMIIHDKASSSGINFETRDEKDTLITRRGLGAETQASYVVDFSDDNTAAHKVYRVFMAFGAGGGTSFTSIDFEYTCATPTPAMVLSAPKTSESVGETIQLTWNFEYVGGTTPTATFTSSDTDVATVSVNGGLVTGLAAGTTTITASFQYDEVTYYSNPIELEFVSSITYKSITFLHEEGKNSAITGAGVHIYYDTTDPSLASVAKAEITSIELTFVSNKSDWDGYVDTLNNGKRDVVYSDPGHFYFEIQVGLPDKPGEFTHTFKITITKSASEVFEGQIVFDGNAYSSQSGTWH